MTVHKLTAGDGYTYLTRQVAAHDATDRGYDNLGAYYSEKGEAPGRLDGTRPCHRARFSGRHAVTEAQMVALFGEGRHPNADQIERALRAAGASEKEIDRASRLGSPYRIYEQANMFHRRCGGRVPRLQHRPRTATADTPVPAEERARIRTELARPMFAETYGRRAARCPGAVRAPGPHLAAGDHRGGRVRPDVHPGQERVDAVGDRPARGRRSRSRQPTTPPSTTRCAGSRSNAAYTRARHATGSPRSRSAG